MTAPEQLATRVMRARTTGGTCPSCRATLVQGQRIAKVGDRWFHLACLTARRLGRRIPMIGPPAAQALGDPDTSTEGKRP